MAGRRLGSLVRRLPGITGLELQAPLKNGAFDFLEKPIDEVVLIDVLRDAMRTDRERRSAATSRSSAETRFERLTGHSHSRAGIRSIAEVAAAAHGGVHTCGTRPTRAIAARAAPRYYVISPSAPRGWCCQTGIFHASPRSAPERCRRTRSVPPARARRC